jgi:allantoicase
MTLTATDPGIPDFVRHGINLADARLGARALIASDEFFAVRERMLDPAPAQFIPGKYDDNGKWMDGWETRRRRGPGHDWCVVRLARPGTLQGFDLDTSHFTGNYPPGASVEGCYLAHGDPDASTAWRPLLPPVALAGDRHHYFAVADEGRVSHLRVNLFPDGGLARLRAYGRPDFDASQVREDGLIDLAAAFNGARAIVANNEHYGVIGNLLMPGRGVDMGDGWETRRRREPGNDWCLIALAVPGTIEAVEVDTAHFKGNYPDRCSLQAALTEGAPAAALVTQSMFWPKLLPAQKLGADHIHAFRHELQALGAVSHVRLNIFPDGGISRLRLWGRPA